jgi:hypothetical protein
MDTKITLSFNASVIDKAKDFADKHNISLSRLTEFLYSQLTHNNYQSLHDLPVSDWVSMVAEGQAEYVTKQKSSKTAKAEYFESRNKCK